MSSGCSEQTPRCGASMFGTVWLKPTSCQRDPFGSTDTTQRFLDATSKAVGTEISAQIVIKLQGHDI